MNEILKLITFLKQQKHKEDDMSSGKTIPLLE